METALLEPLLDSPNDDELSRRLRIHGPVTDREVPVLFEQAKSGKERERRNATSLLRLNRSAEAKAALTEIAAHTSDAVQYVIALGGLLVREDPGLAAVARPELLDKAFASSDPEARAVAVEVMARTRQPQAEPAIEKALIDPHAKVRQAGLRAALFASPAKFKPLLAGELLKENSEHSYRALYLALAQTDDPALAEVFQRSLKLGPSVRPTDFHNGLYDITTPLPWLRSFVVELLGQGGELGDSAFHLLEHWGGADAQLCAACVAALEKAPPTTDPNYRRYMIELERCRSYLGTLAGRGPFTWEEREAALSFARKHLAAAPKP